MTAAPNTLGQGETIIQRYAGLRGAPRVQGSPPENTIMMLAGYPGTGKTYFAESIPNNYILNYNRSSSVNPRSRALQFPISTDRAPKSWVDFEAEINILTTLARENKPRPQMVTFDDLTSATQMLKDWIPSNAKKLGLLSKDRKDTDNWTDLDGKAAFFWLSQRMIRLLLDLNQHGYGVLLLAHLRDADPPDRPTPMPACYPSFWETFKGFPEFIGMMEYRDSMVPVTTITKSVVDGKTLEVPVTKHTSRRDYSIVVQRSNHWFLKARLPRLTRQTFELGDSPTPWDEFRRQYMESL